MTRPALKWMALAACLALATLSVADEGMWLVNQFPKELVKKNHGFEVTDQFLEHLQRSSVRFNNGGSGSFVSPEGLLFTNHHVGRDCIQKVSSAENDYVANGFLAKTHADEKKCPDLEINLLVKIEPVTDRIKGVEKPGMSVADAAKARREEMSRTEKECLDKTGNRCDVVTLFSGARYDLYQYKKYTDVRLVFAPEEAIAAFGGDPDNFTFPRYCLDFSFFRAYEDGKPVKPTDYFKWSQTGAKNNELTFVSGNPGSTGRLMTMAQLEYSRDYSYPLLYQRLEEMIKAMEVYSAKNAENKRVAGDVLLSAQNSYKAYTGFLRGLRDKQLMARKLDEEQTLRAALKTDPEKEKKYSGAFSEIASAYEEAKKFSKPYSLSSVIFSEMFGKARDILRLSEEIKKPGDQRLREYRDSNLESLKQDLFSTAPIHKSLETAVIAENFRFMQEQLGKDDPIVKDVLQGKSPAEAAAHYVNNSKMDDPEFRKKLVENPDQVKDSKDSMIVLAKKLDERNRELRKRYEDKVEAVVTRNGGLLGLARYEASKGQTYPDATFTFRVSYGITKGYTSNGKKIPWATEIAGVYQRATGEEPFKLPESWLKSKSKLNQSTPFNFVSTHDTHGGNSGSPTVNTKGEMVGILFDGNLEGLPNRFVFTDEQARSVHVASQVIIESLKKVYGADWLVKELGVK